MARCRHDFSGHREHVLRSVSPFIDALRHVAADTSQLTVISPHFQLIQVSFNNPPRLLIVNIHCRLAIQRSSAPQIQALRLTAVRVIKCLSVCMYVSVVVRLVTRSGAPRWNTAVMSAGRHLCRSPRSCRRLRQSRLDRPAPVTAPCSDSTGHCRA